MSSTLRGVTKEPVRKSRRGHSRRESILSSAARLFREHGYHATGIDEIGAAAGVTGPAVYRHFESKNAILVALLDRALQRHQEMIEQVLAEGLEPEETLRNLVERSARIQVESQDAAAVFFQEWRNLLPDDRARFVRVQRLFITEWVDVLSRLRPDLPEDEARVAVQATAGILNSVQHLHTGMGADRLASLLSELALAALLNASRRRR